MKQLAPKKNAIKQASRAFWFDIIKAVSSVVILVPLILWLGAPTDPLVSDPPSVLRLLEPEMLKQVGLGIGFVFWQVMHGIGLGCYCLTDSDFLQNTQRRF